VEAAIEPYYVGYVLTTWNKLYHLYDNPVFRAPYASYITARYNGSQRDATVVAKLPDSLRELLTPRYYKQLQHPSGALLKALETNNTWAGWTPDVPVKLFAASGDTTVVPADATQCARVIHAPVVQLGDVSHDVSDFVALPQILRWFQQLS
jgi:hypothetical protein